MKTMRNTFKLASFLCYLLTLVVFFFLGMYLVSWTGAAEGQGLAGGAIVLFYGLITAIIGLVLAIILANKSSIKTIKTVNVVLGVVLIVIASFITYQVMTQSDDSTPEPANERTPTAPTVVPE